VFLPFAYLFSESSGFLGHKKGIVPRLYETSVVFVLLIFVVIGLIYVLLAVFYPERSSFLTMLSKLSFKLMEFKILFRFLSHNRHHNISFAIPVFVHILPGRAAITW